MNKVWKELGFTASPYDSRPLGSTTTAADLLVGRVEESLEFYTFLDRSESGVVLLSGEPGVGKTSFFNVHQFILHRGATAHGPRLLSSDGGPCPILSGDSPKDIALKVIEKLVQSVEAHCTRTESEVPSDIKKIARWAKNTGERGFEIGISILGTGGSIGRTTSLPPISEASFGALKDAIEALVSIVIAELDFGGAIIALDNLENLNDQKIFSMLIDFRDTLFSISNAWWVLIGPEDLASKIQGFGSRIYDRLGNNIIEIKPLSLDELELAISRRAAHFGRLGTATSLLPREVHADLYEASHCDIRFVFKMSENICVEYVRKVRALANSEGPTTATQLAREILTRRQIPAEQAKLIMTDILQKEVGRILLNIEDRAIIRAIASQGISAAEKIRSLFPDSFEEKISRLCTRNLIYRTPENILELRGPIALAARYNVLENGG